jgi:hypothetical protein
MQTPVLIKIAYIYRPTKEVEIVPTFELALYGEDVLPNFVFELKWIQ